MRLALSTASKVCCSLCDWEKSGGSFPEAEQALVDHLRFRHHRAPVLINKVERKQGTSEKWPENYYEGPSYGWRKL